MANSFRADYLVLLPPSVRLATVSPPPSPGVGQHNERNNELTRQGGRTADGANLFVFCRLNPFSPQPPRQCLGPSCPVISLLLTNTVSPVRACLIILWERFRGTQKEDDSGPLGIQSSLGNTDEVGSKETDFRDGILKQSIGYRNQVGIGLSYRPARLPRLAEFIP
jgi:hypothetical protein